MRSNREEVEVRGMMTGARLIPQNLKHASRHVIYSLVILW